ncbi:MAG: hypothetical protein ABIS27_08550, partial [Longimicrobiales bacterium]
VGPGNWPVLYPKHAAPNDPSLDRKGGRTTSNPWPSSDWIAFASERGFAATFVLVLALLMMTVQTLRRLRYAADVETGLLCAALLATLASAAVAGVFDAVLLLALPTLLIWATIGAIWMPDPKGAGALTEGTRGTIATALLVICGVGVVRSTAQVISMSFYAPRKPAQMRWASRIDPGSYRTHLQLARSAPTRASRCSHARAAHTLFPSATAPRSLGRGCPKT